MHIYILGEKERRTIKKYNLPRKDINKMQKIHFRIKRRGSFRWKEGRKEKEAPLGWQAALYVYKKAFIIKAKNKFDVSFVREAAATLAAAATSAAVALAAAASSEKMMDEGYPNRVMVPSVGRFLLLLF